MNDTNEKYIGIHEYIDIAKKHFDLTGNKLKNKPIYEVVIGLKEAEELEDFIENMGYIPYCPSLNNAGVLDVSFYSVNNLIERLVMCVYQKLFLEVPPEYFSKNLDNFPYELLDSIEYMISRFNLSYKEALEKLELVFMIRWTGISRDNRWDALININGWGYDFSDVTWHPYEPELIITETIQDQISKRYPKYKSMHEADIFEVLNYIDIPRW